MRPLALHHMTALELPPLELLSLAEQVGCEQVCLFVNAPAPRIERATVTADMVESLLVRMSTTGVVVRNVGGFPLSAQVDVDAFRPALDLAAALRGHFLTSIVYDPVVARAAENLARLVELAGERRLTVGVEFVGSSPACATIHQAADLVRLVAAQRDAGDVGVVVDCLHLVRSGGTPDDIRRVPPALIAHAQLCDGPDLSVRSDYASEVFDRMVPGTGSFPIVEILTALPATTTLSLELPMSSAAQSAVPVATRMRRAVEATRAVVASADV